MLCYSAVPPVVCCAFLRRFFLCGALLPGLRLLVPCVVACCFCVFVAWPGCPLLSFSSVLCCWGPCLAAWSAALFSAVVSCGALLPHAVSCGAVFPCGAVPRCPAVCCFAGCVCLFYDVFRGAVPRCLAVLPVVRCLFLPPLCFSAPSVCCAALARLRCFLLYFSVKDMRSRAEVAALGTQALKVTLGTWGYWRQPEGKSCGPWPVWRSMLRAQLWPQAEKGEPVSPQIAKVQRLLGSGIAKSHVVPAASGVAGDFKTVEQVDPNATGQTIRLKTTRIAALVNEPPKRFLEIDKMMIVINGDIFEHLSPETMCSTWLYTEMARDDTLICRSQTVVDNMYEGLDTETGRRLNDDLHALGIGNMLRIPFFRWRTKAKNAGDPTMFKVCWLLITLPQKWSRKVFNWHRVLSLRQAWRNNPCSFFTDFELSDA